MSNIRLDLMRRQEAQRRWALMPELLRQERTAKFIAANAQACLWVLSLLRYPPSPHTEIAIDYAMHNVAKQFEETFGLVAPWAKSDLTPPEEHAK